MSKSSLEAVAVQRDRCRTAACRPPWAPTVFASVIRVPGYHTPSTKKSRVVRQAVTRQAVARHAQLGGVLRDQTEALPAHAASALLGVAPQQCSPNPGRVETEHHAQIDEGERPLPVGSKQPLLGFV